MKIPAVAHLEQWFGAWAMRDRERAGLESTIRQMNLDVHVANEKKAAADGADEQDKPKKPLYEMNGDIAMIDLLGPMTKYGSSLTGPGTVQTRRAVRTAAADPNVGGIFLRVHSPGGTTSGTGDLADDVRNAAAQKPVMAYGEDLVASAAYWVASQASALWAGASAEVGSIGTYAVVEDVSKIYDEAGVKVHVVKAGAAKGIGIEGVPVTDEHLAEIQREVDAINTVFVESVASGRKLDMEKAQGLADGRVHMARQAKALGLIDEVGSIDAAFAALRNMVAAHGGKDFDMSTNVTPIDAAKSQEAKPAAPVAEAPKPATLAELRTLEGSNAEFREACAVAGLTLEQAKAMLGTQQAEAAKQKALADENTQLKTRVERLEKCGGAYASGDPGDENDAKPASADAKRWADWKRDEASLRKLGYKSFGQYAETEAKIDAAMRVSRN